LACVESITSALAAPHGPKGRRIPLLGALLTAALGHKDHPANTEPTTTERIPLEKASSRILFMGLGNRLPGLIPIPL